MLLPTSLFERRAIILRMLSLRSTREASALLRIEPSEGFAHVQPSPQMHE